MEPTVQTEEIGINIEDASDSIAADLGFGSDDQVDEVIDDTPADDVPRETSAPVEPALDTPQAPVSDMPQSWSKDKAAVWDKIADPEIKAQILHREKQMLEGLSQYKEHNEFGRTIKDVVKPYENYLQTQGVDAVKAVQYLLSAQYRLSTGDQQTKITMLRDLAKGIGLDFDQISGQMAQPAQNSEFDPLWNEIKGLKSQLTARQEAETEQVRQKVAQDVGAFADDPKHAYFDEVADDLAKFIKIGDSLEVAYEKAVWANPVTRAKELARIQTESQAKLKPQLVKGAQELKKATSSNVRSRDTGRTPTEPLGTMEDTMREVLANRKAGIH